MENKRGFLIRGLLIAGIVAVIIAGVFILRKKNNTAGNVENNLAGMVWQEKDKNGNVKMTVKFGDNSISADGKNSAGLPYYSGTYELTGSSKIKFVFDTIPDDAQMNKTCTAKYEIEDESLTIDFGHTEWQLEMKENAGAVNELNNKYWKGESGKYKDYAILIKDRTFYVIDITQNKIIGQYQPSFKEKLVLRDWYTKNIMYTIEYEIKDTELVLGSGDGQTVFARTEDNYAVDLLKEAETMKEELTQAVDQTEWSAVSDGKEYHLLFGSDNAVILINYTDAEVIFNSHLMSVGVDEQVVAQQSDGEAMELLRAYKQGGLSDMQLSVSIESIEDGETEQLMKPVLFEACTDYIDQVRSVAEEDRFFSIDSLTNMGISYYNEANRISFSLTYEEPYYGVRIKSKDDRNYLHGFITGAENGRCRVIWDNEKIYENTPTWIKEFVTNKEAELEPFVGTADKKGGLTIWYSEGESLEFEVE